MADYTYATVVASNQTLAQRYYPGYFSFGLSASGQAPATHWLTSGPFGNDELDTLANGAGWVSGIAFGNDPWPVISRLQLVPVAGNPAVEPDPITPTLPIPPAAVTPRQIRLALLAQGMLDAVNAAIAAAGSAAQIEWDYATSIRRDHPLIASLMASLGKTEDEVDALFIAAVAL